MFFKEPKNTPEIYWTRHAKKKMRYYRLSEGRLRRILRNPQRREKGIVPRTIALMQPAGQESSKGLTRGLARSGRPAKKGEIWLMYQPIGRRKKIISAWRYPGVSPKGEPVPVPPEIVEELEKAFAKPDLRRSGF